MFDNLLQVAQLLKNAGQIRQNLSALNERLAAARFTAEAGGGQVRATVDGRGELVALKVDPRLATADVEMMEDLICAAVRESVRLSREAAQKELGSALGGIGDMLGLKPQA